MDTLPIKRVGIYFKHHLSLLYFLLNPFSFGYINVSLWDISGLVALARCSLFFCNRFIFWKEVNCTVEYWSRALTKATDERYFSVAGDNWRSHYNVNGLPVVPGSQFWRRNKKASDVNPTYLQCHCHEGRQKQEVATLLCHGWLHILYRRFFQIFPQYHLYPIPPDSIHNWDTW